LFWEKEKLREEKVRSLIRTFLGVVNEVVREEEGWAIRENAPGKVKDGKEMKEKGEEKTRRKLICEKMERKCKRRVK